MMYATEVGSCDMMCVCVRARACVYIYIYIYIPSLMLTGSGTQVIKDLPQQFKRM
jgi:hypothetical protein